MTIDDVDYGDMVTDGKGNYSIVLIVKKYCHRLCIDDILDEDIESAVLVDDYEDNWDSYSEEQA
jgi:hypothetical protein